jgi:hypothetical protein
MTEKQITKPVDTNKEILSQKLVRRNCFWSVKLPTEIPDDILIEKTIIYLDIEDINQLFKLYSSKKIKQVWLSRLVTQGDYYHSLNKLLAWFYFDIKNPDRYIKATMTRHMKRFA